MGKRIGGLLAVGRERFLDFEAVMRFYSRNEPNRNL